jgi:hypothetical protein
MHDPKWCLFFDFHTMPACPDVGANFDIDAFINHIKRCGVDYVVFPAKCNLGMAYYDTKVGIRHPSLRYDLFGKIAEACRDNGIALSAYINVGLSHEEALRHREWCVLTPEGYTYQPNRLDHFFRNMCYNTGYGEHVLEIVREVVGNYPVSGLFLDCIRTPPCIGVECIKEMKVRDIDWADSRQLAEFAHSTMVRMGSRIAEAAKAIRADLLLYFNGMNFEDQQEIGTYLEFECLPTGGWGYELLPVYARYMRTLGKPAINMTGRFHKSWGDFGGIRTEASLEYDCLYGLANGMRTTIGDHYHPRGDINQAVFDLVERIYPRLQKLEPWLEGAKPLTDVAIVAPQPGFKTVDYEAHQRSINAVKGATRMCCELKTQFDILSDFSPWEGYKLLILPDFVSLGGTAKSKVKAHLDSGGAVLSTGWSGLAPDGRDFALKEWGVKFKEDSPFDPAYIVTKAQLSEGMPKMPITLYDRGASVEPITGTQVLANIVAPYYNRHWDGEHGFVYLPPDRDTGLAAVTLTEKVAHISHPVFTSYYNHAPVPMRQLVANLLKMLLPNPLVKTTGLPSFARVTVTGQQKRRMVHLLAYLPERRGPTIDMIEEPIELNDVALSLRLDDSYPESVYLAPTQQKLPFEITGKYVKTALQDVRGYALVIFEERKSK